MDRFIEFCITLINFLGSSLKSNMDRFIEKKRLSSIYADIPLKSNMDRFIAIIIRELTPSFLL